ncbi:MAG: cell division protein FtsZ [Bacteroidia bacterium]|nr:MAG: cell division protein FtsZ [Bacteroidia bacterium]
MNFDLPKNQSSIIKVIGVGGGGSNAVNHMFRQGIEGVDFYVCNTDAQALDLSPVPNKLQLGVHLTEGRGAGSKPEVGRNAALEDIDRVNNILESNTKMLFITAGMGGGTGTGAAPVIAKASKELGVLTVAIVTLPFAFEGRKRRQQAEEGIRQLSENVDTLLIICNDRLRELYGNLSVTEAFSKADNVLTTGAKGIAEIITLPGNINVDFADVHTVMFESGVAIMGNGVAEGENRAITAVESALSSPLLNDNQIKGAKNILLNITSGKEDVLMDEIIEITDYIQDEAGSTAEIIWGLGKDENLGSNISVTLVATGFTGKELVDDIRSLPKEKTVMPLDKENSPASKQKTIEWEGPFNKEEDPLQEMKLKVKPAADMNTSEKSGKPLIKTAQQEKLEQFRKSLAEQKAFAELPETQKGHILSEEEMKAKISEREERLKHLSIQLKTPEGLADLENQPAFVRRKVNLNPVPASNESQISRYTLKETEDRKTQIKSNNSFLHDNVD